MDAVDYFVSQWRRERPNVDVSPMEVIGRLSRLAALVQERLDVVFAQHGLQSWEFDVLATLRRSGPPYELTPGELDRTMMISSGTTTHRISKLEQRGFVTRSKDHDDRRVVRVRLTDTGRDVFDACHKAHLENESRILAQMDDDAVAQLREGLKALSASVGDRAPTAKPQ
jgi:DNA-binding MarR family transcriptional regulator